MPAQQEPDGWLPATTIQKQVWYACQLAPHAQDRHIAMIVSLAGPADIQSVRRCLHALVARHSALRSVFALRDHRLALSVQEHAALQFADYDLAFVEPDERERSLARIRDQERQRPFDLTGGPLIRFALVDLGESLQELLVIAHRLVCDETSLAILARELLECYAAIGAGRRPALPVATQLPDLARRERSSRAPSGPGAGDDPLAQLPDPLELPFAGPRRGEPSPATEALPFALSADVAGAVRSLAAEEGTSALTVVQAAFVTLLHRFTRRDEIVVGTTAPGREDPRDDRLVGPVDDLRALRVRLPYDPTARSVVGVVRDAVREAEVRQAPGFAEVLRRTRPPRHPNMHPVFQLLVGPAPSLPPPTVVSGVTFAFRDGGTARGGFDLEVRVGESDGRLVGHLHYKRDLFTSADAGRLMHHLLRLLERMTATPDAHVSVLPLLDEDEHRRVVHEWNEFAVEYPRDSSVHALFEEWADRTPDAPALHWSGTTLTYGELEARANRLAHYLLDLGVGLETRVGLFFGYTPDWVVGALATLKAGGTYVPLDPAYPAERLATMCADAGVRVLLVHGETADALTIEGVPKVRLDAATEAIDEQPSTRCSAQVDPENLAYVMFTSGSTGRPKGIGIVHRSIVRTVRGTRPDYVAFEPSFSVAQSSNISFDATTLETWGALLNGCRLVGLRKADVLDPKRLKQQLVEHRIDVMFLPAALMKQHVSVAPDTFSSLRYFLSGGEQADFHTLRRIVEHGAPEVLINPYGPTETTVNATAHRCNDLDETETHVPIGRPVENTTCYILDEYLHPVPPGVVGELFIGGDGVARGYLGQTDLTADRLVPDPFSGIPGARLYRSGDLARQRQDGVIDFLGRMDRQLKVRGFRVEPAEIETSLLRSGLVREVSVQVQRDSGGDQVLVAYVIPEGPDPDLAELRGYAQRHLPTYMVPRAFVPLTSFPLNANGKLDARALQRIVPADGVATADPEPVTPLQERLLSIWRQALAAPGLGVHDDFFVAGGDSSMATEVVSRASASARCELSVRLLVEHPTVAAFAAAVDRIRPSDDEPAGAAGSQPGETALGVPAAEGGGESPSGDVTARVLALWREILDAPAVGVDDNFFAAGGHSLKVARVASRVRAEFGVDVPLQTLFEHPTVATFSAAVARILAGGGEVGAVPAMSRASEGAQDVDALLDQVEQLSAEEIERLLESSG